MPAASLGGRVLGCSCARLNGTPSRLSGLCSVGHPSFVAFAVAPMIPMTVPTFSAVTSRKFGGSTSGCRGGEVVGLSVVEALYHGLVLKRAKRQEGCRKQTSCPG
jgi:hypothetical protein